MALFNVWGGQTSLICGRSAWRLFTGRNLSQHKSSDKVRHWQAKTKPDIRQGSEIEGFVVKQVQTVAEFNITAFSLTHSLTGAEYLHLSRNDSNNVFAVGFYTAPFDSTGLSHILEHTTLCGSHRYPCRDPFFKMLNRSMATYMNALTGPVFTIYPFATQNLRDYYNLMSVYLDAVFNPRLREVDFRQEGWRLEHEDINNFNSPIVFKGVVFNEMKGVFADPQATFGQSLMNSILPSNVYSFISGGDPLKIPCLTYEDLKQYHKHFYNPSNSRFFSYGNFPLVDHLKFINKNYLSTFDRKNLCKSINTDLPPEERWTVPRRKHISCRTDAFATNSEKSSTIAVSVLLGDIKDLQDVFACNVLSCLLVRGPNSAFYKSLVEPQIGSGFSPSTGFESQTRDTYFSVGVQEVAEQDFDKVVEIYDKTVNEVIEKGFKQELIDGVLHRMELQIKHDVSNFGLELLFGTTPLWMHGGDAIAALGTNKYIASFRQSLKENPKYLQELAKRKLKDNTHKLILSMSPDMEYAKYLEEEERKLLEDKIRVLSPNDKQDLMKKGQELLVEQSQWQNASCLPTLKVGDLKKNVESSNLRDVSVNNVPVQSSIQSTNGLVYFRGILNVSELTDEQKTLLSLFCYVVSRMDTNKSTYRELDQRINLKTGGLSFCAHIKNNLFDVDSHEEGLLFSSYCLVKDLEEMFNIFSEILNEFQLADIKRFETLTRMAATNAANSIIDRGHVYSMMSSESLVNGSALYDERLHGLTFVEAIRLLAQLKDSSSTLNNIKELAAKVFNKNHLRCAVNYTDSDEDIVLDAVETFLNCIPGSVKDPSVWSPVPELKYDYNAVHHVLPIPVNFAAKSLQTVPYTHLDHAPLTVLAKLLSSKYLHPIIREKGGAYGSGATISSAGVFSFFSYRDPHSCSTLDTFDGAEKWIQEGKFTYDDVEEAKLGVFQRVDSPIPAGEKGMHNFLFDITDLIFNQRRKHLMAVTKDDLHEVAERYLRLGVKQKSGRALVGPANAELLKTRSHETWLIKSPGEKS